MRAGTLFSVIFYLSGISSLIYQVVWQRVLTQVIGVDSISIAFIVTIFLLGLGLGSIAAIPATKGRRPLILIRLYAVIELVIGIFGLASIGNPPIKAVRSEVEFSH
ncbi:hypothetical protein [Castellaniella sp. GW247-6E4]|uniref:hypothetical protein n=1 Tax=Castellaniella sp. GW247-6E4 TaxID=3140380 RepID=UPI0033161D05